MAAIVLSFGLLAWFNYAIYWPVKTLDIYNYKNGVVETKSQTYKLGELIDYELDYCKAKAYPAVVSRTLVDGQVIALSDEKGYLPVGCHKLTIMTSQVPLTINPGRYYLDITITYKINIFRTETVHYKTNYFNVTR